MKYLSAIILDAQETEPGNHIEVHRVSKPGPGNQARNETIR